MRQSSPRLLAIGGREWALLCAAILASIAFSVASPYFATAGNAATIARNSTELMLAGLGMTLLLAMGSIDVSIGILMGLAAIAVAHGLLASVAPALALLIGPVAGAGLGLVTAIVVVLGRVPAIVGTLGLLGVYRMGIFALLGGQWLSGLPVGLTRLLSTTVFGLPLSLLVIGLAYLVIWMALRHTPYGPYLLSIGNAEEKARLSGVPVTKVRIATFVISGALTGIAASFSVANYRNVEMAIAAHLPLMPSPRWSSAVPASWAVVAACSARRSASSCSVSCRMVCC